MRLLVDLGNSRIKWTDERRLLKGDVSSKACEDLPDVLERKWKYLQKPESIWISNVASRERVARLIKWCAETWNIDPVLAKTQASQLDVVNGYQTPSQLGIDRWLSLIGARALLNRALIVVDCGTATTIDAMDQSGRHLGGLILPGLQMMRESLLGSTAIPPTDPSLNKTYFAKDTATAIDAGAVMSTVCLIERMAKLLRDRVGGEIQCVLTGGAAETLKDTLEMRFYHEPNLVLEGLALVARMNDI